MNQVIGFVGLGRMGGPMSGRLLAAGNALCVFDSYAAAMAPMKDAGADTATSPEDIGNKADIVFVSLPTPDVVENSTLR